MPKTQTVKDFQRFVDNLYVKKNAMCILPLFTEGITVINEHIGVQKRNGMVYYFQGTYPFYHHREDNRAAFKHIICQLLSNGVAQRTELSKAFQIPARSISRWLASYKANGDDYFSNL
jgi:hypothetical protein